MEKEKLTSRQRIAYAHLSAKRKKSSEEAFWACFICWVVCFVALLYLVSKIDLAPSLVWALLVLLASFVLTWGIMYLFSFIVAYFDKDTKADIMEEVVYREELNLISCGDHDKIMAYISENRFCEKLEPELIKRSNHEEILAYVAKYRLCSKLEKALIERGNHEEILAYIMVHGLCFESEKTLIERGNHEEIMAIVSENLLCSEEAEMALIKRGNHAEIMAYVDHAQLCDEIELMFVGRGDHEELMVYIKNNTLSRQAEDLLMSVADMGYQKEIDAIKAKKKILNAQN